LERARALARPPAIEPSAGETIEVLRFVLANERYAIELRHVVEVARLVDLTRVPGAPDFLLGVLQRRGEVLAAIDLHRLFGIEKKGLTDLSRAIVLGGEQAEFAVLADEVRDVTRLWRETIQKPPASFAGIWRDYVCGVMEDSTIVLDGRALLEDRRLFIDQGNGGSEEKR
jgi:purine-binding chemotaxis protein CheW